VGAGTGVLTGPLTRAGTELIAIEPGEHGRAQLRRALPGVPVVAARPDRLPIASASTAAVLVSDPDLLTAAHELGRVLRPGGTLVLLARAGDAAFDAPELDGFARPGSTEHLAGGSAAGASVVTTWRRR
jgi:SAM-dependent methyltransferase